MLFTHIIPFVVAYWPAVLVAVVAARLLRNKYHNGLHKYPGPWLAAYTDLWRFFESFNRRTERTHIELHQKYGDIVRVGPSLLSFANPQAIKTIYGLNKGMVKSEFYPVQQGIAQGRRLPSLFSTTDEDYHAKYRRCVNNAFAMSSLVTYEPLVDSTTDFFLKRTQELYASTGKTCNFTKWLQFFAFDVVGELTWSRRLGFLEKNEDVDGVVNFVSRFLTYASVVGLIPILDLVFIKNPIKMWAERHGISKSVFPVTKFALARNGERSAEMAKIRESGKAEPNPRTGGIDLLAKFVQAQHTHSSFMTDDRVLSTTTSMIFAGSDTTAISLSSIFYHLLRHPHVYRNLMQELDKAVADGRIADQINKEPSWAESQKLPYLDACIQEALRLHPAIGLLLERVVPPQGIEIMGERIPGGTTVGSNPWVIHRRPEIFGNDVEEYRPERWLDDDQEKVKLMRATMFQFGAGARTCIGKNISLMEMYKMVPSVLLRFEIELENDQPWKTYNQWFVKQMDFNVRFRLRGQTV